MRLSCLFAAAVLLGFCTATGCVHTSGLAGDPQVPAGFARYTKAENIKAVSPEGVVYRVRTEDNKPYAELPFWKEALKKRMLDAGHVFLDEAPVSADAVPGYLLELTAPHGRADYTYLMAVFVRDKKIIIVESAGEVTHITRRRKAILTAIKALKFD